MSTIASSPSSRLGPAIGFSSHQDHTNHVGAVARWIAAKVHILFLFTASDFKTIVIPQSFFALCGAGAGSVLFDGPSPGAAAILRRAPLVAFWVWINLLPFAIDNQRQPLSIAEDRLNKPWRPLPAGAVSVGAASAVMCAAYPLALGVSGVVGCVPQCVGLMLLGWLYNDCGGADRSAVLRNGINAAGYTCFASGATVVASGNSPLNRAAYLWFGLIVLVVFTTVQMQDIPDQEGDRMRGRHTVPLDLGDRGARWTVAVGVLGWSLIVPAFWALQPGAYVAPVLLGALVAHRALSRSSVRDDRRTFKLWNAWMVVIYCSPVIKKLLLEYV